MREHGVLNRILLVYEEIARRIDDKRDYPREALEGSAGIVQRFIEQYHEKLEEDFLFPMFEKANKHTDLVAVLRKQHQAGRTLTDSILKSPSPDAMRAFVRMYRPHEAREDTVLFPALHEIASAHDLEELGESFEKKEHELFGKEGFEGVVAQVAKIETTLGIHDLDSFTPR